MSLMAGLAVGSRVLGGVGKRRAAKDQRSAAKEGRDIAYQNIDTQRTANAETERRAQRSVTAAEGEARLRSGATGAKAGSQNTQDVLGSLMTENKKQMDWLKLSNQTMLDTMKSEADYNFQTGQAQADASNWSAASSMGDAFLLADRLFPTVSTPAPTPLLSGNSSPAPAGFIKPRTPMPWSNL